MKKKVDQNLQSLDPQILKILEKCRQDLTELQVKKDEAIDEFLEEHTESKIIEQKKIEKKYRKMRDEFKESEDGPTLEEYKVTVQKEQEEAMTKLKSAYAEKSKQGLQQIKEKYNLLSQQINVDTSALTQAI